MQTLRMASLSFMINFRIIQPTVHAGTHFQTFVFVLFCFVFLSSFVHCKSLQTVYEITGYEGPTTAKNEKADFCFLIPLTPGSHTIIKYQLVDRSLFK